MKSLQNLDSSLFKTLEAAEMRTLKGGVADPTNTETLPGITINGNDGSSTQDSPGNPNDGCDDC